MQFQLVTGTNKIREMHCNRKLKIG